MQTCVSHSLHENKMPTEITEHNLKSLMQAVSTTSVSTGELNAILVQ